MAAKTSWHRYVTKLRHCHPVYGGIQESSFIRLSCDFAVSLENLTLIKLLSKDDSSFLSIRFFFIVAIHYRVIFNCRPTNYELLRWLVETPSRDFEQYRMTDDSRRSIVRHFHVRWKCRTIGFARVGHEFDPRPITKWNVIFCTLFLFTFCFVFLFIFLRFS